MNTGLKLSINGLHRKHAQRLNNAYVVAMNTVYYFVLYMHEQWFYIISTITIGNVYFFLCNLEPCFVVRTLYFHVLFIHATNISSIPIRSLLFKNTLWNHHRCRHHHNHHHQQRRHYHHHHHDCYHHYYYFNYDFIIIISSSIISMIIIIIII